MECPHFFFLGLQVPGETTTVREPDSGPRHGPVVGPGHALSFGVRNPSPSDIVDSTRDFLPLQEPFMSDPHSSPRKTRPPYPPWFGTPHFSDQTSFYLRFTLTLVL